MIQICAAVVMSLLGWGCNRINRDVMMVDNDNIGSLKLYCSFSTELRGSPECTRDLEGNLQKHIDSPASDVPVAPDETSGSIGHAGLYSGEQAVLTQLDPVGSRIYIEQCESLGELFDNSANICSTFTDNLKTKEN